jgi:Spy/CpxP family protein refolding chaperone
MHSNKSLMPVAAVLLLAAVATGILIMSRSTGEKPAVGNSTETNGGTSRKKTIGSQADDGSVTAAERTKNRRAEANSELVAKYGESRTNLSKHVTGNIIGILEDAVQMGEMMTSGQMGGFGGGAGMALGKLNGELQLTPEQNQKTKDIFTEYQRRQMANQKNAIEQLRKDPAPLMQLMLASDAVSRGEMQDDEYKSLQAETGKQLMGVLNPLDKKNFGGGSPLRDPEFVSSFRGILDPTQSEKLNATIEQRKTEAESDPSAIPGVEEGNIAGLPTMELEKIDQSVESARKITTGIKSMMDGFSGLKDVIPPRPAQGGN